jgi:hypothetical protein
LPSPSTVKAMSEPKPSSASGSGSPRRRLLVSSRRVDALARRVRHLELEVAVADVEAGRPERLVAVRRGGLGDGVALVGRDVEGDDAVLVVVADLADAVDREAAAGDGVADLVDQQELDRDGVAVGSSTGVSSSVGVSSSSTGVSSSSPPPPPAVTWTALSPASMSTSWRSPSPGPPACATRPARGRCRRRRSGSGVVVPSSPSSTSQAWPTTSSPS